MESSATHIRTSYSAEKAPESTVAPGQACLARRRAVVFDFDGTLADTKDTICTVAREVLLAYGLSEAELGDVGRLVGPPFPQAFSMVYGLSREDAEKVTEEYRRRYNGLGRAAWPLFDGMSDVLHELRAAGRLLAVASSKRQTLVERGLSDNGALELFDAVCGRLDDSGVSKAQTLARALAALGVAPDEAVMVGDRHFDVEAAASCGVPCVGVLYGGTASREELVEAAAIASSVEELGHILLGRGAPTG